jgi:hypothetical protein
MILLRRILFYLFFIAYLVICPLIILYAFGYILQPNSERGMVKTGLISLASVPPGANVYIENKRYLSRTPTVIRDLIPGDYYVSMYLKDYQPASQVISVKAGKASVFEHTLLLPKKWDFQVLIADYFETFIPLAGTHYFLLAKSPRLKDYLVYNWKRGLAWPLLEPGAELNNARVLSYAQERGSNFIFMHVALREKEMFIRFELKDRFSRTEELTRFFYKLPRGVKWDHQDPDNLFVLEDGHLNKIDLSGDGLSPRYLENVDGYAISNRMIYLFNQDDTVAQIDYGKKKSEIIYDGAQEDNPLLSRRNDYILEPLSRESAIFCPEKSELLLRLGNRKLLKKEIKGIEFDPDSKRLAAWQEEKIGVLELPQQGTDELDVKYEPRLVWVFESGKFITQVFWVYKGTHLLFLDNDRVYLLGVQGELNPAIAPLFEVKKNSPICYNPQDGRLFFLNQATGNFSCAWLIPEKERNEIPFFAPNAK